MPGAVRRSRWVKPAAVTLADRLGREKHSGLPRRMIRCKTCLLAGRKPELTGTLRTRISPLTLHGRGLVWEPIHGASSAFAARIARARFRSSRSRKEQQVNCTHCRGW